MLIRFDMEHHSRPDIKQSLRRGRLIDHGSRHQTPVFIAFALLVWLIALAGMALALRNGGGHGFWRFAGTLAVALVLLVFTLRWWQLQVKNRLSRLHTGMGMTEGLSLIHFFATQHGVQIRWQQPQALQGEWRMPDGITAFITLMAYQGGLAFHARTTTSIWPPNHNRILQAEIERVLPVFRLLYPSQQ